MTDLPQTLTISARSNIDLIFGNFEDIAPQLQANADLIFTDPPYKRELAVPCYNELAYWGPQLLKDGGSLLTITPHYLLEEAMCMMKGQLKYRWIYCMNQAASSHPRMAMGIEVMWKPILHYVKRAFPTGMGYLRDMVIIPEPDKSLHEWQQSIEFCEYYITKLAAPGDTVLDPYMGVATTGVVCMVHGINYKGIDNDEETYNKACERMVELSNTMTAPTA